MTIKQYNNMLFTGKNNDQYVRLLSGNPSRELNKKSVKALVFSEGQIFSYVVSTMSKVSAWIVKNEAGNHSFPYLEKSALLLLEATGKLRVKRLVETIQFVETKGYTLSDFGIDTFIQLDSLLVGRDYKKEWIIEQVSHGKL